MSVAAPAVVRNHSSVSPTISFAHFQTTRTMRADFRSKFGLRAPLAHVASGMRFRFAKRLIPLSFVAFSIIGLSIGILYPKEVTSINASDFLSLNALLAALFLALFAVGEQTPAALEYHRERRRFVQKSSLALGLVSCVVCLFTILSPIVPILTQAVFALSLSVIGATVFLFSTLLWTFDE